jgi:hypothetical protein
MAVAYLNEGATSLAAANWSDATGFADNATLVIDKKFGSGAPLTASTDQSGLTTGIDYLDILKGAQGQLGTGASPLQVDADTASGDGIVNYGNVTLYFRGGGSGQINNFTCGAGSINYHVNDTITQVVVEGGTYIAEESAVITNFDAYGGSGEIKYNSTKITTCRIMRGTWVLRRACTNLFVGENARVIIDLDDAATMTSTAISSYGGTIDLRFGAYPTITAIGGTLDLRNARRAFEIGGTAITLGGTTIHEGSDIVTVSNVTNVGNSKRSIGGFVPAPS